MSLWICADCKSITAFQRSMRCPHCNVPLGFATFSESVDEPPATLTVTPCLECERLRAALVACEREREAADARTYETMQNWNGTLAALELAEAEVARLRAALAEVKSLWASFACAAPEMQVHWREQISKAIVREP